MKPTHLSMAVFTVMLSATLLPIMAAAQVSDATKQKVVNIKREYSKFELTSDLQECIDGKLIDPDCDAAIDVTVRVYRKQQELEQRKQELEQREQKLEQRKQELEHVKRAMASIDLVFALVQLGLYVEYDRSPPKGGDYIQIVMNQASTPTEVKSLFTEFLERKKSGSSFTSKADREKLITLASEHLQLAKSLQVQIFGEKSKQDIAEMYAQAASTFAMGKQMLANKQ